jgi:hypothetical protein
LTVKASLIFGKRFTIFKTVNRFPKLSSSSLHACLISDRQNLAIVSRWNPIGAGARQHPAAGIRPPADQIPAGILPESGQNGRDPAGIRLLIWQDLARNDLIRPDPKDSGWNPAILEDPVKLSRRNPATATKRCRIPATFVKL